MADNKRERMARDAAATGDPELAMKLATDDHRTGRGLTLEYFLNEWVLYEGAVMNYRGCLVDVRRGPSGDAFLYFHPLFRVSDWQDDAPEEHQLPTTDEHPGCLPVDCMAALTLQLPKWQKAPHPSKRARG